MKKIFLYIFVFTMVATLVWAVDRRVNTPKVGYIEPKSESVVDLSGKESLTFSWKKTPTPGGGRMAYKFDLYKEFGYEVVVSEEVDPKTYYIEVPSELFEDGALYTWQVKQRDAKTRVWSMDSRWSFTVRK